MNFIGYRNATVDRSLETGRVSCGEADRRGGVLHQMDIQLNEDQPINFGFDLEGLAVWNNRIQGIKTGPFTMYGGVLFLFDVEHWWVKS